jgi:D,D-heptose 1,7-bisphosphate phosphatase
MSIAWVVTANDKGRSGLETKIPLGGFEEFVDEPIGLLSQIIAGARLTLSNDSGLMHLSSAVGTPVLGIFGPTHPALGFSPRGIWDRIIEVDEPCRPCSLHGQKPCYRPERYCLTRISADMVFATLSTMLEDSDKRSPALFLDRDGTTIVDKDYLADPDKVELIPGVAEGLIEAKRRGYKLVILSNQSGVARGMFDNATVDRVNQRLIEILARQGVVLDGLYYCPHYIGGRVPEYSISCYCRKPAPGMAERAAKELGIDLRRSWVIGDKEDDLSLGRVLGANSMLVRTGYGTKTEQELKRRGNSPQTITAGSLAEGIKAVFQAGTV